MDSSARATLNEQFDSPTPPPGIPAHIADLLAADPTNHLAVLEQPANPPGCASGAFKVASYTVDSSGSLTTNATYRTMPTTVIQNSADMKMPPSGKLVAIAGQEGLQVFHFNGTKPPTHYTGLLTKEPVNQMFWDNDNHLYAISNTPVSYSSSRSHRPSTRKRPDRPTPSPARKISSFSR
jgi:hypothetical protein